MPASNKHIMTNVDRMKGDAELLALWNAGATENRTPVQAWAAFIEAADAARIADRIPGTVGRTFKAKYAAQLIKATPAKPKASPARKATTKRPAPKATK